MVTALLFCIYTTRFVLSFSFPSKIFFRFLPLLLYLFLFFLLYTFTFFLYYLPFLFLFTSRVFLYHPDLNPIMCAICLLDLSQCLTCQRSLSEKRLTVPIRDSKSPFKLLFTSNRTSGAYETFLFFGTGQACGLKDL